MQLQDTIDLMLTERPISDLNRRYLGYLKHIQKLEPLVIYDIGSSIGAYAKFCHLLFPDTKVILFEADDYFVTRYSGEDYHIVCLSDVDNKEVKFYNDSLLKDIKEIHSYYKSDGLTEKYKTLTTRTLESYVAEKMISFPDIVKINTCGSELDIIKGGINIIKKAKYLIVKMQNDDTFNGAAKADIVGPYIMSHGFELEEILDSFGTKVVDYVFKNKNI